MPEYDKRTDGQMDGVAISCANERERAICNNRFKCCCDDENETGRSGSETHRKYISQIDSRAVFVVISVYVTYVIKNSNKRRNVGSPIELFRPEELTSSNTSSLHFHGTN